VPQLPAPPRSPAQTEISRFSANNPELAAIRAHEAGGMTEHPTDDDRDQRIAALVRESRVPSEPDIGKLPALSYYERHPEHRPRRRPWRSSIRRRLAESA
jgi:hypothetical protein